MFHRNFDSFFFCRQGLSRLTVAVVFCLAPSLVSAATIYTATDTNPESGNMVSGTAEFSVSGTNLFITLTNTSSPLGTNGDVLIGVLFTPSITPLSLSSADVPGSGTFWTDKATSAAGPANWSANWTDTFGVSPPPAGTVGAAATGFNGMFPNPTGSGADFGIVSNGTFPQGGNGPGNPNKFSLADNSLVLTFSSGVSLAALEISDVRLLFGTSGEGVLVASIAEPATWLLALTGLCVLGARNFPQFERF